MKKALFIALSVLFFVTVKAQNKATENEVTGKVIVNKDARLDILTKKQAEFNKATVGLGTKVAKGYRLLVLSSNDRVYAMKVRAALLQRYPEEKVYMSFQAPFIKLKFGNFTVKSEADRYKVMISRSKIVNNNVYVVSEIVETKADKNKEGEDN